MSATTSSQITSSSDQEQLVLDHLGLAGRLARAYRGRGVESDDLEQVARLALVKAAAGFDPGRGSFAPFAAATIRGELKRHFRDKAWGIRPPRRIQELQARIQAEHPAGTTSAEAPQVAAELDADVHDVREAIAARGCFNPDSIDAARDNGHDVGGLDQGFDRVEDRVTFAGLCKGLDDDERQLLAWRFLEERTQQEIADIVGVSQMQVSRRLKKLLDRLRRAVDGPRAA